MWIEFMIIFISLFSQNQCEPVGWESLGCWRDLPTRAIATLEGKSRLLGDNWKQRANPLAACSEAAKDGKLTVFAVQDGGQCFGGPYAHMFFDQYGPSNLCKGGVGGIWSNSVYSSKISHTRVLESKKDKDKLIKCSKPLDLVFLVDGSGDSNVENKLRWDQILKFISKATEHFDSPSTRFGVISYGSRPKTIVNITDNKDETAMRDSIISADFPGGQITINEALKRAWKEQLKQTPRGRNKVIVALTTSNMDYGPWGSSLFLTNRGVRLLAFGIDRTPSYRFLESLASGRHPENIYSIDSEQMDSTLPFFTKDICTGLKKSKIETIRKDKEIDFISSREFETVGSVVERKSERKSTKGAGNTSKGGNRTEENREKEKENHKIEVKSEEEKYEEDKNKVKEDSEKGKVKGTISDSKPTPASNLMSVGSYEKITNDKEISAIKEEKTALPTDLKESKENLKKSGTVSPVNNSSFSDGEIVEKLKQNALEVLKNTENIESIALPQSIKSFAGMGQALVRENVGGKNETVEGSKSKTRETVSSVNDNFDNDKRKTDLRVFNSSKSSNFESLNTSRKDKGSDKNKSVKGELAANDETKSSFTSENVREKSNESRNETLSNKYKSASDKKTEQSSEKTLSADNSETWMLVGKSANTKDESAISKSRSTENIGESVTYKGESANTTNKSAENKDESTNNKHESTNSKGEIANNKSENANYKSETANNKDQSATSKSKSTDAKGESAYTQEPKDNKSNATLASYQNANSEFQNKSAKAVSMSRSNLKQNETILDKKNSTFGSQTNDSHSSNERLFVDKNRKEGENDPDKEILKGLQQQRESIEKEGKEDDDALYDEFKSSDDNENYASDHKEVLDEDYAANSPPDDESAIDEDERVTQNALEQKKREIDVLLKKLDETRKRRRRRKVLQRSKEFKDESAMEDFGENGNGGSLTKNKNRSKKEDIDIENGMETGTTRRYHENISSHPNTRHFLPITNSDSKPHPIQRPFGYIPTKKALKVLDKLYSYASKPGIKLNYDIFDPNYSSKDKQTLTKSSYKKLRRQKLKKAHGKTSIKSIASIAPTTGHQKNASKPSDQREFFLRNKISSKGEQRHAGNEIRNQKQTHWHDENSHKKHIINRTHNRNYVNSNKYASNATVDVKKVLDDYYSYFLKHMQPVWEYAKGKPKMPFLRTDGRRQFQSTLESKSEKRGSVEGNSTQYINATSSIKAVAQNSTGARTVGENSTVVDSSKRERNITMELKAEQEKTEKGNSRSLIHSSNTRNSYTKDINFKPISFKSLESTDKGNYTIYQFSKGNILINLQSKRGELQTFYGKTAVRRKRKQKRKHVSKTRHELVLDLANNVQLDRTKNPLEGNLHHRENISRKEYHSKKTRPVKVSKPTKLVDNMKYFQSSLQVEPGYVRSPIEKKAHKKIHKKSPTVKKQASTGINFVESNSNRTAYDIYDNRLAHVERQRQYFTKTRPDPDRLIITENNDPYTDSSTVKLFINAGDENSLMPADSMGLGSRSEGETKSFMADSSEGLFDSEKWDKQDDTFAESGGSKYDDITKGSESNVDKNEKQTNANKNGRNAITEEDRTDIKQSKQTLRKIVEKESGNSKVDEKKNGTRRGTKTAQEHYKKLKGEKDVVSTAGYDASKGKNNTKAEGGDTVANGGRLGQNNKNTQTQRSNDSMSHEMKSTHKVTKGERKETAGEKAANDDVWVFRPNAGEEKDKKEKKFDKSDGSISEGKGAGNGKTNSQPDNKVKSEASQSNYKEKTASNEGSLLSDIDKALGCTRPVKVLYVIDVSDAIGTGPTRQRKWNHMKRFLRSVDDRVTHGGNLGYIVYDSEPRFVSNLEPCDEQTEYFVTNGECLCDQRSSSFRKGKSSCSTHAPTQDESIEDWGKVGPRTAKALNLAQKLFKDESLGDSKKLVVLVTHQASTDDVTGAERSLKDDSISLVDIEIGERHNIKKRSNSFDDVIPRDHQMEVSFYKLDKAIENIFMKICKEKDLAKTRRSKIFATLKHHRNWW